MSIGREDPDTGDMQTMMKSTVTATSVKTDALADSLFTIPSGYTKVAAPQRPTGSWGQRRNGGGGQGQEGGQARPRPDDNGGGNPPPPAE